MDPADRKQQVTFRLSPEVLKALRATGDGWRTRVNEILRAAMSKNPRSFDTSGECVKGDGE